MRWLAFHIICFANSSAHAQNQLRCICPSVCPHETTLLPLGGFSWNFIFEDFLANPSRKFKFGYNTTRITGTLHEDLRTFVISQWIILRMRNVSDRRCRENQTYFMINKCCQKIVLFEIMWKIPYVQTGNRCQHNTAHAHCVSGNQDKNRVTLL